MLLRTRVKELEWKLDNIKDELKMSRDRYWNLQDDFYTLCKHLDVELVQVKTHKEVRKRVT